MKKTILTVLSLFVAAVLLTAFLVGTLPRIRRSVREESRSTIREAVIRCAMECYAVEGAYPASLSYLEEHYGLIINHRDYIVSYNAFASNVLPEVQVLVQGEG